MISLSCDNMTRKSYDMSKWKRKRKQQMRGQVQKCTTTTTVQVPCTKRTAPTSSAGKTTPNPYITFYIWVKGALVQKCKRSGGFVQNTIPQNNASSYGRMSSTILILMEFYPKDIYDMSNLEQKCN